MSTSMEWTARDYEKAAEEYLRALPLEHFMEATSQSMQREITVESLALLKTRRPDVQYFNELLVQYPHEGGVGQVVPDNMLIVSETKSEAKTSFAVALEPARPFVVFEYVSRSSKRKDYEDSFRKYEQELKTPYCVMFYPEKQDLRVHRHCEGEYQRLEPDTEGRIEIPELEMSIGILDGWVRFWHQGELLELPAELAGRLDRLTEENVRQAKQIDKQARQLDRQTKQIDEQARQLDALTAGLRAQVEARARKAGRQDILEQLAAVVDSERLLSWLGELS